MNKKVRVRIFCAVGFVMAVGIFFIFYNNTPIDYERGNEVQRFTEGTMTGFKGALDKAEQAKNETELLKERLIEQGYSEETLEGLLASGAQRAVQLQNIAAVKEVYGVPWNLTLCVGEFTLVDLYIVGDKFVLGQYEDSTAEHALWVHMSTTESYKTLQSGLVYEQEKVSDGILNYLDAKSNIVGFAFEVMSDVDMQYTKYVITASSAMTPEVLLEFRQSIIDGDLIYVE